MALLKTTDVPQKWTGTEKTAFRFFFLYFILQIIPLDWKFYQALFSIHWTESPFFGFFTLSRYAPQFFLLPGFANWLVLALIAAASTAIWGAMEKKERDYDNLLYILRVILRYRLAIGVIAYGFIKLFPLQMPFPSLSNLHTNYGDFLPWKIYYHTIGVTPYYEQFLGSIEIVAGLLLLNRRTTTFGAAIVIGFTGNVFAANWGYEAGEAVYSSYLLSIALFLFAYDALRLFNLLILEQTAIASKVKPIFVGNLKNIRLIVKSIVFLFIVLFGATTYANYAHGPYKLPQTPGLQNAYGYYNVREFRFNNKVIPYSRTDSNRWQNVVFEKWATISIKVARPIKVDLSNGDFYQVNDLDRDYESAGVGDRRYYAYQSDTAKHLISLRNKNKNYLAETYSLKYNWLNDSTLVVNGVNQQRDSVYAVLDRIDSKHLLFVGRRKPLKL